jgi:coproporphyrinogen III oxidase
LAAGVSDRLRGRVGALVATLHDEATDFVTRLDGAGRFREDRWDREGGGGGLSRVLTDGALLEKAGVNRSIVEGVLPATTAHRVGARIGGSSEAPFFAAGVSLVVHPHSPMIPTVHLNVRYFEIGDESGAPVDAWFGGGTDLTPTYPNPDDARHFHRTLERICARHHPAFYPRFKTWCDHYFVNSHRADEPRGVGGIFFDHLRPDEGGHDAEALLAFWLDVGRALPEAYGPIAERRRGEAWGERERRLQLFRRGRYVEFNLVHDRGTLFGLQTNARIESVLMSLPPLAAWPYAPHWEPGSIEDELQAMLRPRDWASDEASPDG